jgi:branched-chain amino acid transport system substrate-binding protein
MKVRARGMERRVPPEKAKRFKEAPAKSRMQQEGNAMRKMIMALAAVALAAPALTEPAAAQQKEQFFPLLVYRTGPYAPNGIPFADGVADYLTMLNERDGGINGVKLTSEECETGYATDKGVECYERLKGKGPTGATYFSPLSTGITFALTEKAPGDKIPLLTMGYGRSESRNGAIFPWNFIAVGSYWTAADVAVQHIAHELGGFDKLKGKKITLVYHDSPYGKEPIPALEARAKVNGFTFKAVPVTHPGVEQKSQWLAIRQDRPDYVLLWGWGVMNSTAIKEAAAVGYPRDHMIGVWWSGAEPDVIPAGEQAVGYKALMLQHPAGKFKVHADLEKFVISKSKTQTKDDYAQVLYNRGVINSMIGTEAVRTAMKKFGNKPMTGEQVRWGLENLSLTAERLKELGFEGMLAPMHFSCQDHQGADVARVQQWDGKQWKIISGFYKADLSILDPMVKEASEKYAKEKNITPRDCSKES